MSKKPTPKPDDPEQYKRFLETAEEVEAAGDSRTLEQALRKVATKSAAPKAGKHSRQRQ